MYKLAALFALFACALAAPAPEPAPGYLAAPLAVATVPVATSYANTYKVSVKSPVIATAPYIAAAPLAAHPLATATVLKTASPYIAAAPATTLLAHAPVVAGYHF